MRFIKNWRRCYVLYSVQLAVLISLLGFLQMTILPMWQAQLPSAWYAAANSVLAILLFLVRLIKQGPKGAELGSLEPEEPEETAP